MVESVNAVLVVIEEEGSDMDEVHGVTLGKGKGLAGEAPDESAPAKWTWR